MTDDVEDRLRSDLGKLGDELVRADDPQLAERPRAFTHKVLLTAAIVVVVAAIAAGVLRGEGNPASVETGAPTDESVAPPTTSTADTSTSDASATVNPPMETAIIIDLYSGRSNPYWYASKDDVSEVSRIVDSLSPGAEDPRNPGRLGFQSVQVEGIETSKYQGTVSVFPSAVVVEGSNGTVLLADPGGRTLSLLAGYANANVTDAHALEVLNKCVAGGEC